MLETIDKLARHSRLTTLIGRLILLATEDTKEFDNLISRIEARIDHYEDNLSICPTSLRGK